MLVEETIRRKLNQAFAPLQLAIENESAKHAGHRAMLDGNTAAKGESHFRVVIVSEAFRGKSRLDRHRLVNEALAEELRGRIHALAIRAHAPDEVTA